MPRHFFLLHRQLSEHQALRNEMESIILIYAVTDNILFVRIYFYKYKIIFHISVMHPFTISFYNMDWPYSIGSYLPAILEFVTQRSVIGRSAKMAALYLKVIGSR